MHYVGVEYNYNLKSTTSAILVYLTPTMVLYVYIVWVLYVLSTITSYNVPQNKKLEYKATDKRTSKRFLLWFKYQSTDAA